MSRPSRARELKQRARASRRADELSRPSRARELKQLFAEGVERGMLGKIQKAINASPALRLKRKLIDAFINAYNADGGQPDWTAFVAEKLDKDVEEMAGQYGMDAEMTRTYLTNALAIGRICHKTISLYAWESCKRLHGF